jgi:hypothetical protein
LLGSQVGDPEIGTLCHMVRDGIQEVSLPESHTPIDEQGVIGLRWLFRDRHAGSMGKLITGTHDEVLERVFRVQLDATFRLDGSSCPDGLSYRGCLRRRRGRSREDNEGDRRLPPSPGCRDRLLEERSIVLTQPVTKKLIRNAYLRGPILNPFQTDGHEPGIIDLFRHPALDIRQSFLPNRRDCHLLRILPIHRLIHTCG